MRKEISYYSNDCSKFENEIDCLNHEKELEKIKLAIKCNFEGTYKGRYRVCSDIASYKISTNDVKKYSCAFHLTYIISDLPSELSTVEKMKL